ncbi:hypothetical protein KEM56_001494 [Ascosphaera pollenicola]|nr:hypothetical protein KEM56_001494 [Ascosphaera pollenicola]
MIFCVKKALKNASNIEMKSCIFEEEEEGSGEEDVSKEDSLNVGRFLQELIATVVVICRDEASGGSERKKSYLLKSKSSSKASMCSMKSRNASIVRQTNGEGPQTALDEGHLEKQQKLRLPGLAATVHDGCKFSNGNEFENEEVATVGDITFDAWLQQKSARAGRYLYADQYHQRKHKYNQVEQDSALDRRTSQSTAAAAGSPDQIKSERNPETWR